MPVYRIRAVNTAPDSENRIHDDQVAAAYGFRGGLVPAVTVYGYMTVPVVEHFGPEWLERGAMNVRLREPVYDGEEIGVDAQEAANGRLDITVENGRATGIAWMEQNSASPCVDGFQDALLPAKDARPPASHQTLAVDTVLGTLERTLDVADPGVVLGLANELLIANVVLGPWIHTSSEVRNLSAAHDGETVRVRGRVVEKFERKGHELVVLDVLTASGDRAIQHVRHTAIWRLRAP